MALTEKQRIVLETTAARDKAEVLLRGLLDAKAASEENLQHLRQPDAMKLVTGRSAMDNAITSTRRMIDSLNRALHDLQRDLSDEDLAALNGEDGAGPR